MAPPGGARKVGASPTRAKEQPFDTSEDNKRRASLQRVLSSVPRVPSTEYLHGPTIIESAGGQQVPHAQQSAEICGCQKWRAST